MKTLAMAEKTMARVHTEQLDSLTGRQCLQPTGCWITTAKTWWRSLLLTALFMSGIDQGLPQPLRHHPDQYLPLIRRLLERQKDFCLPWAQAVTRERCSGAIGK